MLAAAGTGTRDLRNKAMPVVAYTTMARRSELLALLREALQVEVDGFGILVIRRGKTDPEAEGAAAPVTPDAMRHLLAWTEAASVADGPLFRAVLKGGRIGGSLDASEVRRVFKAMARAAGLSQGDATRISGHSTRVGAAQDLLLYGETLPAIMQAGRWKTAEMVGPLHGEVGRTPERRRAARRPPRGF
jgi:integrase